MPSVREALSEIRSIRGQMARSIEFRGYGPITLASTGTLAIVIASIQKLWAVDLEHEPARFLAMWIGAAAVSLTFISIETVARARRIHSVLATQMMHSAVEQFMPSIVAGILLTAVLAHAAPQSLWMLPGLWQMLFSLGVFASCRFLPHGTFWVGVWYLATGMACLAIGPDVPASPWEMGIPFGIGHLMVAGVLQFGYRRSNDEIQA
ncbi:MAG TPA: hypothetical protein VGT07_09010 [Steroidobacteraceae bacterium]|nr:hypothetical protein [Steroidobacteraceae bacterium]